MSLRFYQMQRQLAKCQANRDASEHPDYYRDDDTTEEEERAAEEARLERDIENAEEREGL